MDSVSVCSEVQELKTILLHRPGKELEHLTPQYLDELLFEDIPWLERMQEEHDQFAQTLRDNGCEVLYHQQLLHDVLKDSAVRKEQIDIACRLSDLEHLKEYSHIRDYIEALSSEELAALLIEGLPKDRIETGGWNLSLAYHTRDTYPFYINPLPNHYFTRDPGAVIGKGVSLNAMNSHARKRESYLLKAIFDNHPLFKGRELKRWYQPSEKASIEGGDILVLSDKVLAIGCSARTSSTGIETLAERLFGSDTGIEEILVVQLPIKRAYMHLDTVLTMLDHDKFTIYPGIAQLIRTFRLTPGKGGSVIVESEDDLEKALGRALKLPAVDIIYSGGGKGITADREQWNDSTNTLALAPGKVITYRRNVVSNDTLRKHGIEVVEVEGNELVRGRGGPRCMSMPLHRA